MMEPIVKVQNVWKIFGERSYEALEILQRESVSKAEIKERFNCIVGVKDASFTVSEGEIFCVMGLSGSGKSTLIRHINRLLEPTLGSIYINDVDVTQISQAELRQLRAQKIGMVFQNIALIPHRTVRDNVALPLEVQGQDKRRRYEIAESSLAKVELSGWGDKFVHELSGGMQQRVGLARALAANPDVLLMDEPFSALDPLIRSQLQDQFKELSKKDRKTTVFITHDLDEAIFIGDRIAIMNDGVIVQIGTPEEIVTNPVDDYVKDFVADISRLKLVFAHTVMVPIEEFTATDNRDLSESPRVREYVDLDYLIDILVDTDEPVVVHDGDNRDIGVVNKQQLLHGIRKGRK